LAGLCCIFQVQRRRDCHEWMRYTWARWSVFIRKLADHWRLPFSMHAVWGGCRGAVLLFCVVFCFARSHTHRRIHTLLHYWLLILILCLLFINKFVTFVATSSPLPFLVTVLEPGCNIRMPGAGRCRRCGCAAGLWRPSGGSSRRGGGVAGFRRPGGGSCHAAIDWLIDEMHVWHAPWVLLELVGSGHMVFVFWQRDQASPHSQLWQCWICHTLAQQISPKLAGRCHPLQT